MALLGFISWGLFVDACRLLSVSAFVVCSLSFNWYSFASVIALLGESLARHECIISLLKLGVHFTLCAASLYVLDRDKYSVTVPEKRPAKNQFKGKRKIKDEDQISPQLRESFTNQILDLVLYDVEDCQALRNFEIIQRNTHCSFSKRAVLWGSHDYQKTVTVGKGCTSTPRHCFIQGSFPPRIIFPTFCLLVNFCTLSQYPRF